MNEKHVQTSDTIDTGKKRVAYKKPEIKRVDLSLAETLSAGCKLAGVCDDEFDPVAEAGS